MRLLRSIRLLFPQSSCARLLHDSVKARVSSFAERVLDPARRGICFDQYDVETAGWHGALAREVVARRRDEACALAGGDTFGGAAEGSAAPHAHFNEDERVAVLKN